MKSFDYSSMGQLNITYFTDPLCCWSWVFEPAWQRLKADLAPILEYKYCMAGMISSWDQYHDSLNAVSKPIQMGPIWLQAKNQSGIFIDDKLWFKDPPASSYPACVAVKCAGIQSPQLEELYLFSIREAAMRHGQNIARKDVLLNIAKGLSGKGLDFKKFEKQLGSDEAIDKFKNDLTTTNQSGITRFPSLILSMPGKKGRLIITGNRPYEALFSSIEGFLEKV